jgi:hypothetical protein
MVAVSAPSTLAEEFELTLEASQTEQLIHALGWKRSLMLPKVPRDPISSETAFPENPRWRISPHPQAGHGAVLELRDPRYGWIGYAFESEYLQELIAVLIKINEKARGDN